MERRTKCDNRAYPRSWSGRPDVLHAYKFRKSIFRYSTRGWPRFMHGHPRFHFGIASPDGRLKLIAAVQSSTFNLDNQIEGGRGARPLRRVGDCIDHAHECGSALDCCRKNGSQILGAHTLVLVTFNWRHYANLRYKTNA